MKKLLPLALVAALAACNRQPAPQDAAPTAATPAPAPAARSDAPKAQSSEIVKLKTALPEGVAFEFPFTVTSDKTTTKDGRDRRQLRLEALTTDAAVAMREVRTAMKAAGFRPVPAEGSTATGVVKLEGGGLRADFAKPGYTGRVVVTARAAEKGKTRHPDATSVVMITWLMPKPAGAATTAPAPQAAVAAE